MYLLSYASIPVIADCFGTNQVKAIQGVRSLPNVHHSWLGLRTCCTALGPLLFTLGMLSKANKHCNGSVASTRPTWLRICDSEGPGWGVEEVSQWRVEKCSFGAAGSGLSCVEEMVVFRPLRNGLSD